MPVLVAAGILRCVDARETNVAQLLLLRGKANVAGIRLDVDDRIEQVVDKLHRFDFRIGNDKGNVFFEGCPISVEGKQDELICAHLKDSDIARTEEADDLIAQIPRRTFHDDAPIL